MPGWWGWAEWGLQGLQLRGPVPPNPLDAEYIWFTWVAQLRADWTRHGATRAPRNMLYMT